MYSFRIFLFFIINIFFNSLNAQGLRTDIDIDKLNKNIKNAELDISRSLIDFPSAHNFKKYLPYTHSQGEIGMCLAYAITTCRTILYARDNNLTDIDKISFESFSPNYTYIYNKKIQGDTIEDGMYVDLEKINNSGFVKIKDLEFPNYYPFTPNQIFSFPALDFLTNESEKYKFSKFISIDLKDSKRKKIKLIKQFILSDNPAVLSFPKWPASLNKKSKVWEVLDPIDSDESEVFGHAVTLIGYDDNILNGSFLIHNSYGAGWGDNGNMWITYKDFFKYVDYIGFCFTDKVFDFESLIEENYQPSSKLKVNKTEDFGYYINFNWAATFPIVNKLGVYNGELKNNVRSGFGIFKGSNSVTYNGYWYNDHPNGNGIINLPNGNVIDADWQRCQIPSKINIRFNYENIYENYSNIYNGYWNSTLSVPNGQGKLIFLDSLGKYIYSEEGNFNNSFYADSPYTLHWNNGNEYKGEWKKYDRHGYGVFTCADYKYSGYWKDDLMHGENGIYEWSNGYKYIGDFFEGFFHGKGKKIDSTGNVVQSGRWEKDNFIE